MAKLMVVAGGRLVDTVDAPELDAIIQPKPLVDALDGALGWLDDMAPASAITLDADCADLFPGVHAAFPVTRREDFPHFEAWLARAIEARDPVIPALAARLAAVRGPLIEVR